jgi:glycosyltransferase involved in cell wall biosynthesis
MRRPLAPDLRLLVHALDRTGPPMLAAAVASWFREHRPEASLEVLAFRGGPMEADLAALAPVTVVLDHHEPWDVAAPPPDRAHELAARLASLGPAAANLLVSVSAGQVLPLLGDGIGPVATWVVEVGDDLHWLERPVGLIERTDIWWAGSAASEQDLRARPALASVPVCRVPELIADPTRPGQDVLAERRAQLGASPDHLLVVGAGIATWRKGIDLFAEAAATLGRRHVGQVRCHWVGGVDDPLWPRIEVDRAHPDLAHLTMQPPIPDLAPTLAAADVLLHPARQDAFPLVCVLAAALGTPVVGFSGCGGLTEMLGPGFRGAPYPDLDALVDHVLALRDPGERAAVAAAQRAAVAPHLASSAGAVVASHLDRLIAELAR